MGSEEKEWGKKECRRKRKKESEMRRKGVWKEEMQEKKRESGIRRKGVGEEEM